MASASSAEGALGAKESELSAEGSSSSPPESNVLTPEQKARIEKNREAARQKLKKKAEMEMEVQIQQSQQSKTPSSDNFGGFGTTSGQQSQGQNPRKRKLAAKEAEFMSDLRDVVSEGSVVRVQGTKLIDTGGGFLIEEGDLVEQEEEERVLTVQPAPFLPCDTPICLECRREFPDSYLYQNFDHRVCDSCKDMEEKHKLITKTDARNEYLLKDVDLDKREPILKYISRPNPHNNRWGDMKLYLRLQVEKRAIEVWGSLEEIEEQLEIREDNKAKAKIKKYGKKMESLRMSARSSLYTRDLGPHEHIWGSDECVDEDEDIYKHKCTECGQEETFEKM